MIFSIRDKRLDEIMEGRIPKRFPPHLVAAVARMVAALVAAKLLDDLRSPPGNRLEALIGDRRGQHSVRVNAQWRLCFRWTEAGATDVELVDYH